MPEQLSPHSFETDFDKGRVKSPELAERIAHSTDSIHEVAIAKRQEADKAFKQLGVSSEDIPKSLAESITWRPESWDSFTPEQQEQFFAAKKAHGRAEYYDWIAGQDEAHMAWTAEKLDATRASGEDTAYYDRHLAISELSAKVDAAVIKLHELPLPEAVDWLGYKVGEATKRLLDTLRPRPSKINTPGIEMNDRIAW